MIYPSCSFEQLDTDLNVGTPRVPLDIIEDIIDYLSDDKSSLIACSLASRECLRPTRRHLFKSQYIDEPYKCTRFQALLKEHPHLAKFVRILTLCGKFPRARRGHNQHPCEWNNTLPCLFRALVHLEELQLAGLHWSELCPGPEYHDEIFPHLRHLSRLSLYLIRFDTYDTFRNILCATSQLTGLTVSCVIWDNKTFTNPIEKRKMFPSSACSTLQHLSMNAGATAGIVDWLISSGEPLSLRKLVLHSFERDDMESLTKLLQACGTQLEELELDLGHWSLNLLEKISFDLSYNTGLVSVRLFGIMLPSCPPFISTLFGSHHLHKLRSLFLELVAGTTQLFSSFEWDALEEAFAMGKYPSLTQMTVHASTGWGVDKTSVPNIVNGALSKLRGRPGISITVLCS